MKLKLTLLALIVMALCSSSVFAQEGGGTMGGNGGMGGNGAMLTPEQRIEKRLAHEQKKLGLTDDQVAKLRTIIEQNLPRIKSDREAMRAAAPGDAKKDAAKTMQADMKSMRMQLKDVLSPAQLKQWKQMRIDQIDRREERLERQKQNLEK